MENNRFYEATEYLQKAVDMNPSELESHIMFIDVLLMQQRYDEATAAAKKAITFFSNAKSENAVAVLQKYFWLIEDNKKTNKK
jgi:tetratricopeptide (TPR) repeat protein